MAKKTSYFLDISFPSRLAFLLIRFCSRTSFHPTPQWIIFTDWSDLHPQRKLVLLKPDLPWIKGSLNNFFLFILSQTVKETAKNKHTKHVQKLKSRGESKIIQYRKNHKIGSDWLGNLRRVYWKIRSWLLIRNKMQVRGKATEIKEGNKKKKGKRTRFNPAGKNRSRFKTKWWQDNTEATGNKKRQLSKIKDIQAIINNTQHWSSWTWLNMKRLINPKIKQSTRSKFRFHGFTNIKKTRTMSSPWIIWRQLQLSV